MIQSFRHAGLVVRRMEQMVSFYRELFHLRVVSDQQEGGRYLERLVGEPGAQARIVKMKGLRSFGLELLCFEVPRTVAIRKRSINEGFTHLAFRVENLSGLVRRFKARGGTAVSTPLHSRDGRVKVLYARDPEGNLLELVEARTI